MFIYMLRRCIFEGLESGERRKYRHRLFFSNRMVKLLLRKGADKEVPDRTFHYTPLFEAVIKQTGSCVNLLLDA